jgi:hypothetical protein
MRMLKELAIAIPVLFLLFLLTDRFLDPTATRAFSLTNRGAWVGAELVPAERLLFGESIATGAAWRGAYPNEAPARIAKTPTLRIRDVFAQFASGNRSRQG